MKSNFFQALLQLIRDGLRSDGRVWLRIGSNAETGLAERVAGPSLRAILDAGLDQQSHLQQPRPSQIVDEIAKVHLLNDLLAPISDETSPQRRALKFFLVDLKSRLDQQTMLIRTVTEQDILKFEYDMLDAGDGKSEDDRIRAAIEAFFAAPARH